MRRATPKTTLSPPVSEETEVLDGSESSQDPNETVPKLRPIRTSSLSRVVFVPEATSELSSFLSLVVGLK